MTQGAPAGGNISGHLGRPALLTGHVIGPSLTAADQMLAMGDQPLVLLAGEQVDAVDPGVVPEPVAGHADLATAGRGRRTGGRTARKHLESILLYEHVQGLNAATGPAIRCRAQGQSPGPVPTRIAAGLQR